jgi:HEAT repeat protein
VTTPQRYRWLMAVFAGGLAALATSGCADGFVPELRSMNPWVRQQWAQDEQFGATYHRKVSDLKALRSTAKAMAAPEQERVAQELVRRLEKEEGSVMRSELIRTLGELPAPAAYAALQGALADESTLVRQAACRALGRQPTDENLQALARVVASDGDRDVRIAAARELGHFPDAAAAQALRPALDDDDAALQSVAMQSLRGLTGKTQYGNHVPTWREYLDGGEPAPPPGPSLAESFRKYLYW